MNFIEQELFDLNSTVVLCRENVRIISQMATVDSYGSSRIKIETAQYELAEALIRVSLQKEINCG